MISDQCSDFFSVQCSVISDQFYYYVVISFQFFYWSVFFSVQVSDFSVQVSVFSDQFF